MREPQDLLREYAQLNSRRKAEGLSPLEYQRWLHLPAQLERDFPGLYFMAVIVFKVLVVIQVS